MIAVAMRIPRGSYRGIEEGTHWHNDTFYSYSKLNSLFRPIKSYELACFIEDHGWEAVTHYPAVPEGNGTNRKPVGKDKVPPDVEEGYDAFEALGGYILPRDVSRDREAYIRKARTHLITLSPEEVAASGKILYALADENTCVGRMAGIYAECTDWAYDVLTGKEIPPSFDDSFLRGV